MNKQYKSAAQRGIEWTDYTWNPVGGCKHACRWTMPDGSTAICYAEAVAEGVARSAYPTGFAHHYWRPAVLDEPLRLKTPARIFLDSMSDLMGAWVPDAHINAVLDIARQAHWHTFQLLTKNAPRLEQFDFPPNVWVGVSAPPTHMFGRTLSENQQARLLERMLKSLGKVDVPVRWMSIEPLSFNIHPYLEEYGNYLDWFVIGAATNGRQTFHPRQEWVQNVLNMADFYAIPVFFKGNLNWSPWREDFPHSHNALPGGTPMQQRLL